MGILNLVNDRTKNTRTLINKVVSKNKTNWKIANKREFFKN